ncbi:hypothetical protein B0O80DRAFT_94553 [Mortierella sp. GBAus27b]|nr:hypothetical protein B0O80DRAFT_94553 [Mortierella sp. GBAus27b]
MDYEDDDDGQYQQYEDELYKDPSSDSEGSDELNSDLEDTMLSHVYYSTNVYKKAAAASSAKQAGDQDNSSVSGANRASQNDQLAIPRTPAEDYHQAISRETEQDSESDDNNADDGDDGSDSGDSGNGDDEEDNEDDEEDDDTLEAKSRVKRARYLESTEPTEQLDEHVLDLGATADDDGDETNYDLKAELGHLEDENFKGRSRYYLDEKERSLACHRCGLSGHLSRNCTTKICNTCGAKGDHTFTDCPFAVCYNCQKKGHLSSNCPYPRGYGVRNFCDKCGLNNHVTEDCPTVWREYVCKSDEPLYNARQYCYNCAAQDHFGDARISFLELSSRFSGSPRS